MTVEHPSTPAPLTLSDADMVAIGAYVRGVHTNPDEKAIAIARVGMQLTKFFIDVARVAVEHYDRETDNGVTE